MEVVFLFIILIEILSVIPSGAKKYFSVNVAYDSCSRTWNLAVRDSTEFTNPSTGAFLLSDSGVDTTFTSIELPYLGALWNHGTSNEFLQIDFRNFYHAPPNHV